MLYTGHAIAVGPQPGFMWLFGLCGLLLLGFLGAGARLRAKGGAEKQKRRRMPALGEGELEDLLNQHYDGPGATNEVEERCEQPACPAWGCGHVPGAA